MAEKKRIVLIDGHSILNRAFYGLPILTNSEGLHTNAVYGFLNIFFKVIEQEQADYAAVAFDLHAPTFRHKMYDAYKGTRKGMPEELKEQVPLMKEMLTAMGIPVMQLEGYEADDILGTVSQQMAGEGLDVKVVSGDRDLLQLARDNVEILIPKTKSTGTEIEEYYAKDVEARYQVTPTQFIDLKALMGDTSDNIPGVPGIGEKTAMKIISQYGCIEEAYLHVEDITPKKAKESLREHYDLAQLSKVLATIDLHAPIQLEKEQASLENIYTREALELCRRLEFKNLLGRFQVEEKTQTACKTVMISDLGESEKLFSDNKGKALSFYLVYEKNEILGLALCFDKGESYYLDASGFITSAYLCDKLETLVKEAGELTTMQLKEQLHFIQIDRECRSKIVDTAIAAYLVNPLKDGYEAEDFAREYLNQMLPSKSERFGKLSLAQVKEEQTEQFLEYVGQIVSVLYQVRVPILEKLQEMGMLSLFHEIEMPLVYTLADMELEGIRVKADELKAYGKVLSEKIVQLEEKIFEQAGEKFNINSPKQLGVILFEKLNLPHGKKTKTGYSTAADVLEKLASEYPIVSNILEYRQMSKLKSTYADGLAAFIGPDGRIHGKFYQTITATGRISSAEPNLQNIPIRMEMGRMIRKVFVPEDGFVFLDADYSQIELRVLAHLSEDQMLIQAYREAQDIHTTTAAKVFHVPVEEVTPLLRRNAKAVNFGIVYGISSFGLSQDLSITRKEAEQYIQQYFITYPGIKLFLDQTVEDAKEKGYVTTMYGRRRPMPELKSSNFMQRSFGERVAMNAPIQGTAADIIKIAMNRVNDWLRINNKKSRLILQVHDELLVETAVEELDEVRDMMVREMQNAASMSVQLEVDIHDGKNWYEAK